MNLKHNLLIVKCVYYIILIISLTKAYEIKKCCGVKQELQEVKAKEHFTRYECSGGKNDNCVNEFCIDKLKNSGKVISLRCLNNTYGRIEFEVCEICCPAASFYNPKTKHCDLSWSSSVSNLFQNSYQNISFNFPDCKNGSILDLNLEDLNYNLHTKKVFTIQKRRDFEDKITNEFVAVNLNNTCVGITINNEIVLRTCVRKDVCNAIGNSCIRKCCPSGEAYMKINKKRAVCVPMPHLSFEPHGFIKDNFTIDNYAVIHDEKCTFKRKLGRMEDVKIFPNGTIYGNNKLYSPIDDGYCMEKYHATNQKFLDGSKFNNGSTITLLCEAAPSKNVIHNTIVYSIMIISALFLFLTLLIYILLPELRNKHGKIVMCHVSCMFLAFVALCFIKVPSTTRYEYIDCLIIAYVINFSFLATFSWLNVMCFDIWYTFGAIRPNTIRKERDKKFISYCIYAFGVAIFFTLITILADKLDDLPEILKPNIGIKLCFYHPDAVLAKSVYFLLPISAQLFSNIVFFGLTVRYYFKVKYNIMKMNDAQQKKSFISDKKTFITVLKLSLVMGLTWIADIVSMFLKSNIFWQFFDCVNASQGIFIFLIFLLKPRVLKSIKRIILCSKNQPVFESSDTNATNISASKISGLSQAERKDSTEMAVFLNNKRKSSNTENGY